MLEERFIAQVVAADKAGYDFLSGLFESMKESKTDDIYVDFSKCGEFDANLSAVLGAFLDKMTDDGHNMYLRSPKSAGVKRALSRNKFFRAFDLTTKYEDRENYIEYKRFGVSDTQAFKEYIDSELIQKERFPSCSEKAKLKIIESIYEIFANAVSHSGCSYVYCCGEVHTRKSKIMLDMTFVNLGKSVVDNVNVFMRSKGFQPMDSCKTLEWAFVEGNTTKPIPGGLGLAILKQFIEMNDGTIQMVSGDAMLEINGNTPVDTKLDKWFPGTIVTVEFNCDDDKTYMMTDELPDRQNLL